jgi:hypothetical protein
VKHFCVPTDIQATQPARLTLCLPFQPKLAASACGVGGTILMRTLALFLVVVAMTKVTAVQWLYRSASDDVIVNAYRPRALEACGRDGRRVLGLDASIWAQPTQIHLEIGQRVSGVQLWQVDDPAWPQRWRNPFLHLTAGANGAQYQCIYDVMGGTASASKI